MTFPTYCRPDRLCHECRALTPEDLEYARRRDAKQTRQAQVAKAAGIRQLRRNPPAAKGQPGKKRIKRGAGWQYETTKGTYGNTVQGAWRRNNAGGWSRS